MAEAQEGPPRKTTTYKKFSTMASQNERYNVKDDEFFWLENIMRTGPRVLKSVPGPGPFLANFPPAPPVSGCPPTTPPANTEVRQVGLIQTRNLHVDPVTNQPYFGPPDSENSVMSYGLITPDEVVYGLQKLYSGPIAVFAGYAEDNVVGTKYVGVVPMETQENVGKVPSSVFTFRYADHPNSIHAGDGGVTIVGTSDEQSYVWWRGSTSYFSVANQTEVNIPIGGGFFTYLFVKYGNDLVLFTDTNFGALTKTMARIDLASQSLQVGPSLNLQGEPGGFDGSPKATASYFYVMMNNDTNYTKIHRLNKADLSVNSSIDISSISALHPRCFDLVDDNTFYIVTSSDNVDPAHNYETLWFYNGTLRRVGSFRSVSYNPTGWFGGSPYGDMKLTFMPTTRYLYVSAGGQFGYDTDILKIGPMECP